MRLAAGIFALCLGEPAVSGERGCALEGRDAVEGLRAVLLPDGAQRSVIVRLAFGRHVQRTG